VRAGVVCLLATTPALVLASCTDGPDPLAATDTAPASALAPAAEPAGAVAPTRHVGPQGGFGQFVVECDWSHSAPDDPIVHAGMPGMSHRHDFFGNTGTDSTSTPESLLGGDTTCQNQLDTAAYWAPSLLVGGEPVRPSGSTAYYRAAPGVDPTRVVAFPPGLMIVAGDMLADAEQPQPVDLAGWACGVSPRQHPTPPSCPASAPLRGVVTFPDCWDGEHLDAVDHRSHMANSRDGECPASHPVHVPQLTFAIDYPVTGADNALSLASGELEGLHSDFVNAWHQEELERKVELCLHRDAVCGLSSNRHEEPLFSG
jgi:hypothetical protein